LFSLQDVFCWCYGEIDQEVTFTPSMPSQFHVYIATWIQFKIAALTFDCVQGTGPAYFSSIVYTVADNSGRPGLRSAEHGDLFVPRTRTTRLGRRSFFIAAPVVWNSLLLHLRSAGLKTHLFTLAFH